MLNVHLPQHILNPIAAYDAFAPYYKSYSEIRSRYLRKVEDIVVARAPKAGSLLDVGAGNGARALRIAQSARIARVVLVEPSAGMRALCPDSAEVWPCSASEIPDTAPQFSLITCLWNVLGHIPDAEQRLLVLSKLKRRLNPEGAIFLDVTHRYNAAAYGWTKTFFRIVHDSFPKSRDSGDVIVSWKAHEHTIHTQGHVFTHAEMKRLFRSAGLEVVARWVINYENGAECRFPTSGNLLYQLAAAGTVLQ